MTLRASIIIPSNRRPCLEAALESVRRGRTGVAYEVVVVGELPPGMGALRAPERFVPCEGLGTGAMRNLAARGAEGEVLLFTDSDCIVDPDWLERAVAACTAERPIVAGGIRFPEENACDCGDNLAIFHAVHVSRRAGPRGAWGIGTNNLAVRREAFGRLGGFDDRLSSGEDADFLHRAVAAGLPVWFDPSFAVKHCSGRTTPESLRQHARWYSEGTLRLLRGGNAAPARGVRADAVLGALPGGAAFWSAVKATAAVLGIVAFHPPFWRLARAWPWAWWFLYCRRREMFRQYRRGDVT